jgi:hypothetical protein
VAHADGRGLEVLGLEEHPGLERAPGDEPDGRGTGRRGDGADVADAEGAGLPLRDGPREAGLPGPEHGGWWETEPPVGRVVDGMAHRVGQLRALGNGQVPSVVAEAWRRLMADVLQAALDERKETPWTP